MKCVKCGREVEEAEFCGKCGAPQPGAVISERPAQVKIHRGGRRRKYLEGGPIGIAIAVVLSIVVLAVIFSLAAG